MNNSDRDGFSLTCTLFSKTDIKDRALGTLNPSRDLGLVVIEGLRVAKLELVRSSQVGDQASSEHIADLHDVNAGRDVLH